MSFRMSQIVRDGWLADQRINARGILVDRELLDGAIFMAARAKQQSHDEIRKLTKVDNPNSTPQFAVVVRKNDNHLGLGSTSINF